MRTFLLAFSLGITQMGMAQLSVANKAKMDSLFDRVAQSGRLMGSVILYKNGTVLYQRSLGWETGEGSMATPATANTRYRIGSISKVFTSVLVHKAFAEGKLKPTDKLSRWFPQIPRADSITLIHLLGHQSGIHNITNDSLYASYEQTGLSQDEMLKTIAAAGSDFAPGTKAEYSNSGYILLSFILEKVYRKTYAQLLEKQIAKPLELPTVAVFGVQKVAYEAASYSYRGGQYKTSTHTHPSVPQGAGFLIATPTDLARFATALFQGKLLSAEGLQSMQTLDKGYGRGLFRPAFYKQYSWGHTGGIDGFSSDLGYFPEDSLVLAVCVNGSRMSRNDLELGVLSIYYNKPYKLPEFSSYLPDAAALKSYVGEFESDDIPLKITVALEEGTLTAQATGQGAFPLDPVKENEFQFKQAGVKLVFSEGGKKMELQQGGRSYVYRKME